MNRMSPTRITVATSTFLCGALLSFGWSEQRGLSPMVDSVQARVGRPLTPLSVAGVARRHTRRAYYGAAAVGTAAAVAATSSHWGWRGHPYHTGYSGDPYYGQADQEAEVTYYGDAHGDVHPLYSVRAYYVHGPWYGHCGWYD